MRPRKLRSRLDIARQYGGRMNARAERFPLFDSLRAFAALSVLAFHAAFPAGALTSDSVLRPYLARLDVGVSVFFLVSGFLLYRPFVRARLEGRPLPHVGAYAWRRFLRIVPAYWVALTIVAIWFGLGGVFTASGIPTYYGFAQIYSASHSFGGIAQAWTLCVEVTFYAMLPLWAVMMRSVVGRWRGFSGVRGELLALAALWCFSLLWKLYALRQVDPTALDSGPWLQPLPNFLDQFALGMALAVLSVRYRDEEVARPRLLSAVERRPWIPWLGAAVAFWAVSTQVGLTGRLFEHTSNFEFLARHELYSLVALGVILPAVFGWQRRDALRRLLGWRPLLFVGLVSYGVYLWQNSVVRKLAGAINDWLVDTLGLGVELRFLAYFALGSLVTVAIATLSYYLVERPALSLKRLVGPPPAPDDAGEAIAEPAPATAPGGR
jgi:peptidoglycan/LPS O-acetylase OafA/YrhL